MATIAEARVPDNLELAEAAMARAEDAWDRERRGATCATCARFDPCQIPAYAGVGLCVDLYPMRRPCRECGHGRYEMQVSWEWAEASDSAADCDGYAPLPGTREEES